jgi:hypothetical protein
LVANGEVGTSFAAPMVAGVVALMLQANPTLTARDVRHIIAATATKTDVSDAGWLTNAAGLHWSPKYGFGRIDAQAAVTAAQSATLKPAPANSWSLTSTTAHNIPDATGGVQYQFKFHRQSGGQDFHAEWVELTVNPTHLKQKDLEYTLTSPSGTKVVFARRPSPGLGPDQHLFPAMG